MYEYNCRASKFQRVSSKHAACSRFVKKTISTKHNTPQPILSLAPQLLSEVKETFSITLTNTNTLLTSPF